jgi:hypothetical protein
VRLVNHRRRGHECSRDAAPRHDFRRRRVDCRRFQDAGCTVAAMKNHALALLASANASFTSYDIDCVDSFVATGGQTALNGRAGNYGVACTKDGAPMSGEILGVFHSAPAAAGKWDVYRAKVIKTARAKGCPAVAVRKSAPTINQQGEAHGAYCVKS